MEAPPPSSDEHKEYEYEYESASSAVDRMPPGFRFHPTDAEIIIHYLLNKVIHPLFRSVAIADNIDLNKCEPWDLPQKAGKMVGEKEWFFFFEKEAKYPSGTRTNRATASGYWKATGRDKEILIHRRGGNMGIVVGMKKTLVFYKGRAPKGDKTNWVLHEYRLHGDFSAYKQISNSAKAKWVVCRVSHNKNATTARDHVELSRIDSFVDSPTPLTDYSSLSRKPSSAPAPQETYQIIPITTSSSTLMTSNSNIMLQEFQQHHQNYNFLLDPYLNYSSTTNPNYSSHNMNSSTLPYESPSLAYQDGLSSSMTEWYLTNFPIKGGETDDDKSNEAGHVYIGGKETERVCKMEATSFDSSPSQDTGLSTEMVAAAVAHEINWEKERESKKADDAVAESDLCFSPNISEMDSLWSY